MPFIGDGQEATLCVLWYWLFIVGFVLGTFVTPYALLLVLLAPLDVVLLLRRVSRRIDAREWRILRLWLSTKAQYQAYRYLFGRPVPPEST